MNPRAIVGEVRGGPASSPRDRRVRSGPHSDRRQFVGRPSRRRLSLESAIETNRRRVRPAQGVSHSSLSRVDPAPRCQRWRLWSPSVCSRAALRSAHRHHPQPPPPRCFVPAASVSAGSRTDDSKKQTTNPTNRLSSPFRGKSSRAPLASPRPPRGGGARARPACARRRAPSASARPCRRRPRARAARRSWRRRRRAAASRRSAPVEMTTWRVRTRRLTYETT